MTVSVSLHRGCESPKVRKLRLGFMLGERSSKPLGSELRSLNEGGNLDSCLADRVRNPSDTSSDAEEVSQGFRTPRAEDETQVAKRYPKGSKFPNPSDTSSDAEEVSQGLDFSSPPFVELFGYLKFEEGCKTSNPWDTASASEGVSERFGNFEPFGYLFATCVWISALGVRNPWDTLSASEEVSEGFRTLSAKHESKLRPSDLEVRNLWDTSSASGDVSKGFRTFFSENVVSKS